jgi:hypothetical protein
MEEKINTLYNNLVKDNYDLPDFETFKVDMSDNTKSQKLYETLVADNYDLPDFNTFVSDLNVKKKEPSVENFQPVSLEEENFLKPSSPVESESPLPSSPPVEEIKQPTPVEEVKPAKTIGEWITGAVGIIDKGIADVFDSIDYIQNSVNDAVNQILLGQETAAGIKKMREEGVLLKSDVLGRPTRPFNAIADAIRWTASDTKPLPETIGGNIVTGTMQIIPDILVATLMPEVKTAQILQKAGVESASKFGMWLGAKGAIANSQAAEEDTPLQQTIAPAVGALEGYMTGWMFDALGGMSGKLGSKIAAKIMPEVKTTGGAINKALLQSSSTSLTNAVAFGGYSNLEEYLRTGKISAETFATNAGIGLALGVRESGKLLWAKGLNSLVGAPADVIARLGKSNITSEELASQAKDKIKQVEDGTSKDVESDLAAAKLSENMAALKVVIDEVKSNADEVLKSIDESSLDAKSKEVYVDKVNEVIADTHPNAEKIKPVSDELKDIDRKIKNIKRNKSLSDTEKKLKIDELKLRAEELQTKVAKLEDIPIEVAGEQKPKSEENRKEPPPINLDENKATAIEPKVEVVEAEKEITKELGGQENAIRKETEDTSRIAETVPEQIGEGERGNRIRNSEENRVEAQSGEEVALSAVRQDDGSLISLSPQKPATPEIRQTVKDELRRLNGLSKGQKAVIIGEGEPGYNKRIAEEFAKNESAIGAHIKGDKRSYLNIDRIGSVDQARIAWLHETFHGGIERVFKTKKDYDNTMNAVINGLGGKWQTVDEIVKLGGNKNTYKTKSNTEIAEEYMAFLSRKIITNPDLKIEEVLTPKETNIFKQVYNTIMEALNKLFGVVPNMTERDIANLIMDASKMAISEKGALSETVFKGRETGEQQAMAAAKREKETRVFVAPLKVFSATGLKDKTPFEHKSYGELTKTLGGLLKAFGYPKQEVKKYMGLWAQGGDVSFEGSGRVDLPTVDQKKIDLFSAISGTVMPDIQNSVMRIRFDKTAKNVVLSFKMKDVDAADALVADINELLKRPEYRDAEVGQGASFNPLTNTIEIGVESQKDFIKFEEIIKKHNDDIIEREKEAGELSFMGRELYRGVLQEYWDSNQGRIGKKGRSDLDNYVAKALEKLQEEISFAAVDPAAEFAATIPETTKKIEDRNADLANTLSIKFFPLSISRANTALWKRLAPIRDAASDAIARTLQQGEQSQNDALRWVSKAITNLYGGLGRTEKDIMQKLTMVGTTKDYAIFKRDQLSKELYKIINSNPDAAQRVRDVLDPKIVEIEQGARGEKGEIPAGEETLQRPLTYEDLKPEEKALHDALKNLNTWVHETNFALGFLSEEQYNSFKDENGEVNYIARMYDVHEQTLPNEVSEFVNKGQSASGSKLNLKIFKHRELEDEWKKAHAITDPVYLTTKRVMQTIQNAAVKTYMDQVIKDHPDFVRDIEKGKEVPKGFTKLSSSNAWGSFKNKAVINHVVEDFTGFFYANSIMNKSYDLFKALDRTGLTQFYKKFHTVYNPFVQTGNFTGNMFFGSIAGINPVKLVSKMPEAVRDMKAGTEEYGSLLKSGIMGAVGQTGDMVPLTASNKSIIKEVTKSEKILERAAKMFSPFDEVTTKLYQGSDNLAKYAAYKVFREQGLSHEQSIRRVYDSFQNYTTVGKMWDYASKTPLLGNKFIKFQADLQRILLNGVTTSPASTLGTLVLIALAGELTSKLSGEDPEKKKIREERKGVPSIPIPFMGNIPLSFKIGGSEVNVARYLSPLYVYHFGDGEIGFAEISKYIPYQFQENKEGKMVPPPAFSDPVFGWIAQIVADRDFRGASISKPNISVYNDPGVTTNEKLMNTLNYVGRSQIPFYRSAQDIYDGITGNLDYYGRKRDFKQSLLNNIIKIQEFGDPELQKYMENNIDYLTHRFASLSEKMGNANSLYSKEINKVMESGLPENILENTYKEQEKLRAARLDKSLGEQVKVYEELERLTETYSKWFTNDEFLRNNYEGIQSGINRRFNVLDDMDFQKTYPEEYTLLKKNGLMDRPEIPKYYKGTKLTDDEKQEYMRIYWSEYIQQLDKYVGLTQEEIDAAKERITGRRPTDQSSEMKETTRLDRMSSVARTSAKERADRRLRTIMSETETN